MIGVASRGPTYPTIPHIIGDPPIFYVDLCHSLLFGRAIAHTVLLAKLSLEGKMCGCGIPGRLPLICRFSRLLPVSSTSKWRTFILVNFDRVDQSSCADFPVMLLS